MHDILEGTLQLHMKQLLKYIILEESFLSLDLLNTRISSFVYGPADTSNKPTIISNETLTSNSNTLKQSCKLYHTHAYTHTWAQTMEIVCTWVALICMYFLYVSVHALIML